MLLYYDVFTFSNIYFYYAPVNLLTILVVKYVLGLLTQPKASQKNVIDSSFSDGYTKTVSYKTAQKNHPTNEKTVQYKTVRFKVVGRSSKFRIMSYPLLASSQQFSATAVVTNFFKFMFVEQRTTLGLAIW